MVRLKEKVANKTTLNEEENNPDNHDNAPCPSHSQQGKKFTALRFEYYFPIHRVLQISQVPSDYYIFKNPINELGRKNVAQMRKGLLKQAPILSAATNCTLRNVSRRTRK